MESGIGSGMGRTDVDYSVLSPHVVVTDEVGAYRQDIVVVLRAPDGKYDRLRRGAVLVSMLHFATRPARVRLLQEMGIDAVSLDLIRDDDGARLIENLRSVAWNGIGAAFAALERSWPELAGPRRSTVKVLITVLAASADTPSSPRRSTETTPATTRLRGPACPASR